MKLAERKIWERKKTLGNKFPRVSAKRKQRDFRRERIILGLMILISVLIYGGAGEGVKINSGLTMGAVIEVLYDEGNWLTGMSIGVQGDLGIMAAPTIGSVVLNSSLNGNRTDENLTVYVLNVADGDGDDVKLIYDWRNNDSGTMRSIAVLNMPFENYSNNVTNRTIDYSTWGNNGTVNNSLGTEGATFNNSRGFNKSGCYEFDGLNDFINISGDASLENDELSIEFWANTTQATGTIGIVTKYNGQTGYSLGLVEGNITLLIGNGSNYPENYFLYGEKINDGNWHHIVGIFNVTNASIYVDGTLNAIAPFIGTFQKSEVELLFGYVTGLGTFYEGSLDEVRIYNRTLTAEQVRLLYANETDIIAPDETSVDDIWAVEVTPNDNSSNGVAVLSDNLKVLSSNKSCGLISSNVVLENDVSTGGNCFNFGSDNVILDCNGKLVEGLSFNTLNIGMEVIGQNNVTIKNCTLINFTTGILVEDSNFTTLWYNNISSFSNISVEAYGIRLEGSSHSNISKNKIHDVVCENSCNSSDGGEGISLGHNVIVLNEHNLIEANTIERLWGEGPTEIYGIRVGQGLSAYVYNNTVKSNVINNLSSESGDVRSIITHGNRNVTVWGNNISNTSTTSDNQTGIFFSNEGANISENRISGSRVGIMIGYIPGIGGKDVVVKNNFVYNNTIGIQILYSNNITVDNLEVNTSSDYDFYFSYAGNVTLNNSVGGLRYFSYMSDLNGSNLTMRNENGSIQYDSLRVTTEETYITTNSTKINNNLIDLNSSYLAAFNVSANISLYGVDASLLINPRIHRDGIQCGDICGELYNVSNTYTFNVSQFSNYSINDESVVPNVTSLLPANNSVFNVSNRIEIGANVTDSVGVSLVFANVTYANGTVETLTLSNGTDYGQKYNNSFVVPGVVGVYNVSFFANDTSRNYNITESTNFTVQDVVRPNVTSLLPANNSVFNVSNRIEIGANVTDDVGVNNVSANLTLANGSVELLHLSNSSAEPWKFNISYILPTLIGVYNVSFFANDSSGNYNITESTNFTVQDVDSPAAASTPAEGSSGSASRGSLCSEGEVMVNGKCCIVEWNCDSWGECSVDGKRIRECFNAGTCPDDYLVPIQKQNCTYITAPEVVEEEIAPEVATPITLPWCTGWKCWWWVAVLTGAMGAMYYGHRKIVDRRELKKKAQELGMFILQERAKGVSDKQLKKTLVEKGWPGMIVDEYVEKMGQKGRPNENFANVEQKLQGVERGKYMVADANLESLEKEFERMGIKGGEDLRKLSGRLETTEKELKSLGIDESEYGQLKKEMEEVDKELEELR